MKRRKFIQTTGAAGLSGFFSSVGFSDFFYKDLASLDEKNFRNPAAASYPHVFWHWMNGHVSKDGITKDLEAMRKIGIAGVFNFDVGTGIPKGPVEYLSNEWLLLKEHAIREADRLGLAFTMHNCPGWSSSGGPWITPELAMQQVTWSEEYVAGGKNITVSLRKPIHKFDHYHDISVIAFPSLQGEDLMQTMRVRSAAGDLELNLLSGEQSTGATVYPVGDQPAWIGFEFERPFEARQLTFFISAIETASNPETPVDFGERTSVNIESSTDGKVFRNVTSINTGLETELRLGDKYIVFDIPVTTAKYFRITSNRPRRYRQVQFSSIHRLENWMEKTNTRARHFTNVTNRSTLEQINSQSVSPRSVIDSKTIVDLTPKMDAGGTLRWNAPAGNWTILRIGFTPIGTRNRAAPNTGIGLECDKYNPEAISFHFKKMMERLLPASKALASKKRMALEIDSYEVGCQNWTPGFENTFRERWKYAIVQYLPVLAGGRIVDSVLTTERFLWDFRRLQADLIAENYYRRFTELCHENGLKSYIQPYESGPMEEMQIGSRADMNLGEFLNGISTSFPAKTPVRRTPKLASSIAHTNGQHIVAAEAFTSEPDSGRWQEYPFALKAIGDKNFTRGINQLVIHRFTHQPHPTAIPGMTMGPWGMHFDRTNTWWTQARAWLDYLARCQATLQKGSFVADLVYFTGEDANMYTRASDEELIPHPPPRDMITTWLMRKQFLRQKLIMDT